MRMLIGIVIGVVSVSALAERHHRRAVDMPPVYVAECGSCHVAFPPRLLSADHWRRVMAGLDEHYGDDASLDAATRAQIENFLVANGGSGRRVAGAGDPPRLTETAWFTREHDEVPAPVWRDDRVKSAANCSACHTRADKGSYREGEIVVPGEGRRRWRD